FRIRRAEWVAGAFLLLAVVALVASLVTLSRARGSFEATVSYRVSLAHGYGITAGSRVEMLGIDVGRIERLEIDDDNRVAAELEIRERFAPRVREDSVVSVKASLDLQGVLGGVGLAITPGSTAAPVLAEGATLTVAEPESFADLLPMVGGDPLVEDLEALIHNARRMSDEVADPDSPLYHALAQVTALLEKVQDRKSTVGRLLQDDGELYTRLIGVLDEVDGSIARLDKVLARSDRLMRGADGMVDRGGTLVTDMGALVDDSAKVVAAVPPVLDDTDAAMKELSESVKAFGETTRRLTVVVEALGPLVEDMDDMVEDMDAVAEAAAKIWPLRRHARKAKRGK
ncbi:MAG: MlaD family protein, partial [Nannocystaceae bacterium]